MDPYDYFCETAENIVSYTFQTKTSTEYRAYFYPAADYTDKVQDYAHLRESGFTFGFTKVEPNEDRVEPFDGRVKATIKEILKDFLTENNDAIILFHCDNNDSKQSKRSKNFSRWYEESEMGPPVFKEEDELETRDDNGDVIQMDYIGFLTLDSNPYRADISNEFHEVKRNLISGKG